MADFVPEKRLSLENPETAPQRPETCGGVDLHDKHPHSWVEKHIGVNLARALHDRRSASAIVDPVPASDLLPRTLERDRAHVAFVRVRGRHPWLIGYIGHDEASGR
jgi:hypothetical protein